MRQAQLVVDVFLRLTTRLKQQAAPIPALLSRVCAFAGLNSNGNPFLPLEQAHIGISAFAEMTLRLISKRRIASTASMPACSSLPKKVS